MQRVLRVVSYNIHKGFSVYNRRFVLARIREALRRVHADLVFLQEVQGEHHVYRHRVLDWPEQSQFEFLADELWPHYAYGKNAVYTSGHHGNAILSKFPISSWENIDVSTSQMERRGILHAAIDVPRSVAGGTARGTSPLHAICVHLGLLESDRVVQLQSLADRIDSHVPHREALVIGGDFNDWRSRATRTLANRLETQEAFLALKGNHARTFPSWMPALRLDRVYYRGLHARRAKCLAGKPWSELSDHAALLVELDYAAP